MNIFRFLVSQMDYLEHYRQMKNISAMAMVHWLREPCRRESLKWDLTFFLMFLSLTFRLDHYSKNSVLSQPVTFAGSAPKLLNPPSLIISIFHLNNLKLPYYLNAKKVKAN